MAECMLKKADNAYELYTKLSPILRSHNNPDLYKTEPYVLPGNTDGPESPYFGRGGWSWYTGSSAWLFKVLTEYMLGIRPTYEGLLIDPCIPRTWSHFKVRRLFRNAIYLIDVENPRHVSHGVRSITINSKYQRSNLITPQEENKVHRVKVVMG